MTATLVPTAVASRPPTADEIRQALTESVGEGYPGVDNTAGMLRVVTDSDMARVRVRWDPDFYPSDDHPGTLWADMRPGEFEELNDLMTAVLHDVEREATEMLIDRATAAAVAFAKAHPDIPRGHWALRKAAADTPE